MDQSTKKFIETLITDENGAAQSGKLDSGIYTVHQTKGSDNYKIADY
ncbi:SpaA isopeptide-forming pilin-related protein, partial [Anaerostipes hadrus]